MGIQCEINVFKASEGAFKPGGTVSGMIKYHLKDDTAINKIIISFKGNGYLLVKSKKRENNVDTHRKSENYIETDYVIYSNDSGDRLPKGTYQTQFNFILPQKLPTTLKYCKRTPKNLVRCLIAYFIVIKFERHGVTKCSKKFRKEIKLISIITPRLPMELTIYGEKKTMKHVLRKTEVIDIKAFIENSVTTPGDRIKIEYDVKNDTFTHLQGVVCKLVEVYTFNTKGNSLQICEDINETKFKTSGIKIGDTKNVTVEIKVPFKLSSLEYSNLVSRNYFVCIIVEVPKHPDAMLKIPIQISDEIPTEENDVLPSYWEVLHEEDYFNPRRSSIPYESDNENEETEL